MKYSPLIIKHLAKILVGDNTVNRLSGKDLVDLFNEFGFNDDYVYPNVGISTADLGNGLSRTDYARKRLKMLNDKEQVGVALSLYLDGCADKAPAEIAINSVIGKAPDITDVIGTAKVDFQPHSQFDDIKSGVPTIFISYSWDTPEHKHWAKQLADDLRSKHNVCTLIDQYNAAGANIVDFMNKGIRVADRVLMIGTPEYKRRMEDTIGTGSNYEGVIITTEIYKDTGKVKFIPLLRNGDSFDDSFINIVSVLNGYDFRKDEEYEAKLQELADELYGRNNKIPALGGGNAVAAMSAAYKGERWLYELMQYFSFYLMDGYFKHMPCRFDMRVMIMFDSWSGILNSSVFQIHDAVLKQRIGEFYKAWRDICDLGWRYYSTSNNGIDYVFYGAEFDMFKDHEHEEAFKKLTAMIQPCYDKYRALVGYLDALYPQIDREKVSVDFAESLNNGLKI